MIIDFEREYDLKEKLICDKCNCELLETYPDMYRGDDRAFACKNCSTTIFFFNTEIGYVDLAINNCLFRFDGSDIFYINGRVISMENLFPCDIKTLYEKTERILLLC